MLRSPWKRLTLLLAAVWTLTAAPLLCSGGLLTHLCPDDDGAKCEHEEACAADPCDDLIVRRPSIDPAPAPQPLAPLALPAEGVSPSIDLPSTPSQHPTSATWTGGTPPPPGIRPLLI
jgi:hypothetical protein